MNLKLKKLAVLSAKAADAKKAEDITILDLSEKSSLADFMIIASVESAPQMEAVEEEVSKALKAEGIYPLYRDGAGSGTWRVLDYGGIIIHLFLSETRSFYALEKLYHWAPSVAWRPREHRAAKKASAPRAKTAHRKKPLKRKTAKR